MEYKGIVRNLDALGRFVIPKELRDQLGIAEGTDLEMFVVKNEIRIRVYYSKCEFCNDPTESMVMGHRICPTCVVKISGHQKL